MSRVYKRKLSIEGDQNKKGKTSSGPMSASEGAASGEAPRDKWAAMMDMMHGLSAKMDVVHVDIREVRKELGSQIAEGNKETAELRKRMDENDANFEERVAAVVAKLPTQGSGWVPVLSGQSGVVDSYGCLLYTSPSPRD